MYCNKCGETLPEGSRFCNNCGAQTVAASGSFDGPVAVASYADEQEIFTLRPTMIFVLVRYIIAALITIAAAALMGILSSRINGSVAFFVILGAGLIAFSNPIYKHFLWRRTVYRLTNYKLEMRKGIIAKIVQNIPLVKIQDVTVTASVLQRFLNLGGIEIDSASETGKIIWHNIHHADRYANMILAELRRRN